MFPNVCLEQFVLLFYGFCFVFFAFLLIRVLSMEGMRSRMLPDSMRVGSFTIFCNPNSLIISSSLLWLLAVLVFVVCWLSKFMSGRLKSPAVTTLGVFFRSV